MDFRCGEGNDTELFVACLNGGNCTLEEGNQVCLCPPGWKADYVGYAHFDNCTLPDNYLYIYFVVCTVLFVPCLALQFLLIFRGVIQGKYVARYLKILVFWQFMNWIHILCVYVQDGFFEAAIVSAAIYISTGYLSGAFLVSIGFRPVAAFGNYGKAFRKFELMFWIACICFAIVTTAILLTSLKFCRDASQTSYNSLMLALISFSIFCIFVTQCVIMFITNRLQVILSLAMDHNTSSKSGVAQTRSNVQKQMKQVFSLCASFILGDLLTLITVCVWQVYGSFPYFFIGWSVQFCMCLGTFPLSIPMLLAIKPYHQKSDGEKPVSIHSAERVGVETIVDRPNRTQKLSKTPKRKVKAKIKDFQFLSKISEEQSKDNSTLEEKTSVPVSEQKTVSSDNIHTM